MNEKTLLYLSKADVEKVAMPMAEIISQLEKMFVEKGHGRVEMPPKPGVHPLPDAFIHAMPALIPAMQSVGVKWVSGFPQNQAHGLPYIHGLLILNDPSTGIPISVMDCTWITAQRTGAATAIAAKYLARPDSQSVGILACGVQGRSNLEALHCLFRLKKVRAYDTNTAVARDFQVKMSQQFNLDIEIVDMPEKAVRDMDLIVTSGPILKNPTPTIQKGWLKKGSFASPVDFDSYWTPDSLKEASKIATDDIKQMQYYREAGYFKQTPTPYADLSEIIIGKKSGRTNEDEITMSINLGIALEDMATAPWIYKTALAKNLGTRLPL